ncbi:MAG: hypothetical protein ABGW99_15885 [Zunongwangia sp.]|uniref:hypothetical protein n=1 Tax=Zunongwangia sp. TaxID=1965325 RepID=UPI002353E5C4
MNTIYTSKYFAASQCDNSRRFYIDFGHKTVKFSFCQLLAFRHRLKSIDIEQHLNGNNAHGIEILSLCNREHLFIFNTLEILDLLELLNGTFAMMEINSVIA